MSVKDNRDLFGFDRQRGSHSRSSSLGPSVIRDEMKYIHDDDDVIVKVSCLSSHLSFCILRMCCKLAAVTLPGYF